jgi:hypothetical protein
MPKDLMQCAPSAIHVSLKASPKRRPEEETGNVQRRSLKGILPISQQLF